MAGDGGITALAMSAFFGLCVPGVSSGKIEQTFPTQSLLPLTDQERKEFADAIKGEDTAFRIKSDAYLILVTTKAGRCHVITADGGTEDAKDEFQTKLRAANGSEEQIGATDPKLLEVRGMIWTNHPHDGVVVGFSANKESNTGFYAYAFGIHKD